MFDHAHHSLLYQYCLQTAINLITQSLGVLLPNMCAAIIISELIQSRANNKPGYYKTDRNVNITVVFIDNRTIFISAQMHRWHWQRHNLIKSHWHRHNLCVCANATFNSSRHCTGRACTLGRLGLWPHT